MKIEKLNDRQIRCTLTQEDLAKRHINLSELAYGTEKTRALFQDMMTQAAIDFGFEAEDIPLMIEAIPLSPEKIVLIITKVDSPDELDTRFSSFTHGEDFTDDDFMQDGLFPDMMSSESDLSALLNEIKKDRKDTDTPKKEADTEQKSPEKQIRHFSFTDMNTVIEASQLISHEFRGESAVYKDPKNHTYHLFLHQGAHKSPDFNRIVHILSVYLKKEKCTQGSEAYYAEHSQVVLAKDAIRILAEIHLV